MSKRNRQQDKVRSQTQQNETKKFVFKATFCIVIFNILVRSDLWISISFLIFVCLYFLQAGMLKNILKISIGNIILFINHFFEVSKSIKQETRNSRRNKGKKRNLHKR